MKYNLVSETAKMWDISERSVRNYCAKGRVKGAKLEGKTWKIPTSAQKPVRINKKASPKKTLYTHLIQEKKNQLSGGIYHKLQIEFTYNSNHIEGSKLTEDETRYIYETNTIYNDEKLLNINDVMETVNHFRCIDYIIDNAHKQITETMIKKLHEILKTGTSDEKQNWVAVGVYKQLPNEVGGRETCSPENVSTSIKTLLKKYNTIETKTFDDILDFHHTFECIHPFQDGNGRVGRLLMLKECLKYNIVPFIITEDLKLFYYRGLSKWDTERGYLADTCLTGQDAFKKHLDYFKIPYEQ